MINVEEKVQDLINSTDKIAKEIPFDLGMTIDKALEVNPELRNLYEQDAETKEVIDILLENGWYEKRIRGSHHKY